MKVGDLVRWASNANPDYYGKDREAVGVIINLYPFSFEERLSVIPTEIEILLDGKICRWHTNHLEVVNENR